MKALVWLGFGLLAAVWTGLVALAVQLSGWLLGAMAGAPTGALPGSGAWPVPPWLAPWVDAEWFAALQVLGINATLWLGQVLPQAGGLMEWISPLLWTGWALGLLPLLALALLLHWLVGRKAGSTALRST